MGKAGRAEQRAAVFSPDNNGLTLSPLPAAPPVLSSFVVAATLNTIQPQTGISF